MHELPLVRRLLELVLSATPDGARVLAIDLKVGALCDAEPGWLERYLGVAARGTPCEGAALRIVREPVVLLCPACGTRFAAPRLRARAAGRAWPACPSCGSREGSIDGGLDMVVERIEVSGS